ncbi:chemotaxis protein CheW [Sphingomonas qilianensis]|uniref:Chemotaxis protein CheW n=1 Tax=Sphingomonas qilianensis TaxID=1736690 RepID=A0ABU9XUM5_9SPHN
MPAAHAEQVLTFRVADALYAIPASTVREVLRRPSATPVPHAPASLIGLGNVRGTALPLISLAVLLGQPARDGGRVIVLEQAELVGMLVDEVSAVVAAGAVPAQVLDLPALLDKAFGAARSATRDARVAPIAAPPAADAIAQIALLSVLVGGQEFALPLHEIDAVTRLPADIALSSSAETAIVDSDHTLPLLSLRLLLGLQHAPQAARPQVVSVQIGGRSIGLIVDAVGAVLRVAESIIDPLPTVLSRGPGDAQIQAVCRLDQGRRLVSILAVDHLLQEGLAQQIAAQQRAETTTAAVAPIDSDAFLTFQLGHDDVALPIAAVAEVRMLPARLTRLPRTPDCVAGALNLRGQVIPIIDQHRRLLGGAGTGKRRRVVVVALGERKAGFIVDRVAGICHVPRDAVRPAPELGEGTRAFGRAGAGLTQILDPKVLLRGAEHDLGGASGAGVPVS